jgi:hypothetical protein
VFLILQQSRIANFCWCEWTNKKAIAQSFTSSGALNEISSLSVATQGVVFFYELAGLESNNICSVHQGVLNLGTVWRHRRVQVRIPHLHGDLATQNSGTPPLVTTAPS